jgi:hypothetical protein
MDFLPPDKDKGMKGSPVKNGSMMEVTPLRGRSYNGEERNGKKVL